MHERRHSENRNLYPRLSRGICHFCPCTSFLDACDNGCFFLLRPQHYHLYRWTVFVSWMANQLKVMHLVFLFSSAQLRLDWQLSTSPSDIDFVSNSFLPSHWLVHILAGGEHFSSVHFLGNRGRRHDLGFIFNRTGKMSMKMGEETAARSCFSIHSKIGPLFLERRTPTAGSCVHRRCSAEAGKVPYHRETFFFFFLGSISSES